MMLPCKGGEEIIYRLFEPLGYKVDVEGYMLDEKFPEWGKSRYYTVSLKGGQSSGFIKSYLCADTCT